MLYFPTKRKAEAIPPGVRPGGPQQFARKDAVNVKKRAGLVFLATAIALTGIWTAPALVSAQETAVRPTTSQYKIGVVDMKGAFDQYERQKQEYDRLRSERDAKQQNIDSLAQRLESRRSTFMERRDRMTTEEREAAETEINSLVREYEAEFRKLQGDIDSMEQRIVERIFRDIHAAISEVALRDDYHMVLEATEGSRTGVLFSSPTLDITQKIVEHLNATRSTRTP